MFRHISRAELLFWSFGDVQTKQDSFTMYLIYITFTNVCKNVILTTKYNSFTLVQFMFVKYDTCICLFYTFIFFTLSVFMSVGWGVKWCPVSRIHLTTSLARKRPFEEDARDDRCLLIHIPDNSLITRLNHRCGVWWQEFQPHIVDTICWLFRIGAAIIHEKNNFFFLPAHLAVEFWSSRWKFPLSSKRSYVPCS